MCHSITSVPIQVVIFPHFPHSVEKAKLNVILSSLDPAISELSSCLDAAMKSLTIPDSCRSNWSSQLPSISPTEPTATCKLCLESSHSHSLELPPKNPVKYKFMSWRYLEQDNVRSLFRSTTEYVDNSSIGTHTERAIH